MGRGKNYTEEEDKAIKRITDEALKRRMIPTVMPCGKYFIMGGIAMPKNLTAERKYIVESKVDEWDGSLFRNIVRWYWDRKVKTMPEGEVLKMYQEYVEMSKPLAWLNGGEK